MFKLQPDVKKEVRNITIYCIVGAVLEIGVLALLHFYVLPDKIVFDYRTFLSVVLGCLVAILNFVLMGLTVQKVAGLTDDQETARKILKGSYSKRMLMQVVWIILTIALPFLDMIAGIIPLLFPTLGIKVVSLLRGGRI